MSASPPEQQLMEPLMKPEEVAPLFNVKPSTVKGWARRHKIPFTRTPGGEIRIRPADVEVMLSGSAPAQNENGPAGAATPSEP